MKATLTSDNEIKLEFKFDRAVIDYVRQLDGRRFTREQKAWFIPLSTLTDVKLKNLEKMGFYIDPAINEAMRADLSVSKELERLQTRKDAELETTLPLFPFQRVAVSWMVKAGGGINAYPVGSGKSLQFIATAQQLKTKKNLIVCPKSLLFQWGQVELPKWDRDAKVFIVYGTKNQRIRIYQKARNYSGRFYLVVGYEVARIDYKELQKF